MVEIENNVRGLRRYGSKLTHLLNEYTKRGDFLITFLQLGSAGKYEDAVQLFVCTSKKNFRSIWRKVENVMQQHRIYSHVFYLVADNKYWVEPLQQAQFMEHNEQQTKKLVATPKTTKN